MKYIIASAAIVAATLIVNGAAVGQDYAASPSDLQAQQVSPPISNSAEPVRFDHDRKQAVRRNAEFRAHQRMRRISARQWSGNSAFRPRVSATSLMSPDNVFWGGNAHAPFGWVITR